MATPAVKFELSVDQRQLVALRDAMRLEADGKILKKELTASFRAAVEPGIAKVKNALGGMPSYHAAQAYHVSLGDYIKPRVKASVRLSGSAGVSVRIPQTPGIRGFAKAARWLNRPLWRHPVFNRPDSWIEQYSPIPNYFDDAFAEDREKYREACLECVHLMFRRIAERR